MDTLCCSIKHPYSEVLFYQEIFIQGWPEPRTLLGPRPVEEVSRLKTPKCAWRDPAYA